LVTKAQVKGAIIHHLSSAHSPGERLDDMTGVGAILSYKLHGVMDMENEDSDEEIK